MFFNTKINRFEVDPMIEPEKVIEDFDLIDNYKQDITKYMYDNIKIGPETDFEIFIQSRIQMFLSQTLLRSLFLKDEIVHALNENNFPAFYALVKSFLEISAQLGHLTFVLYEDKPDEELREVLHRMVFGHRVGMTTEIGTNPISVMEMFDSLDIVFQKIELSQTNDEEQVKVIKKEKPMRTIYEDICNFGHPNFMSHLSVGGMNEEGFWVAKNPKKLESYKYELYGGFYMMHFTNAIRSIHATVSMITRHKKVDNFAKLNNPKLSI